MSQIVCILYKRKQLQTITPFYCNYAGLCINVVLSRLWDSQHKKRKNGAQGKNMEKSNVGQVRVFFFVTYFLQVLS